MLTETVGLDLFLSRLRERSPRAARRVRVSRAGPLTRVAPLRDLSRPGGRGEIRDSVSVKAL